MAIMRQRGPTPVSLWHVINGLANARNPNSRARRRCLRLCFWGAIRELSMAGLLFRHGPLIALARFATMPKPRTPNQHPSRQPGNAHRLSPSAGEATSETGGSNPVLPSAESASKNAQMIEGQVVIEFEPPLPCTSDTKSAPAPEIVTNAARALARLPRHRKRRWSGWLDSNTRVWRGRRIILPSGELAHAYGCLRNNLVWSFHPERLLGGFDEPLQWGVLPADCVRVYQDPNAKLLGGRKLGRTERSSFVKRQTARQNGSRPVRPGRRPRGRPRTGSKAIRDDGR